MTHAQSAQNKDAYLYLTQGVGRRVGVLRRTVEEIFHPFPPERTDTLSRDELAAVQINLHAFVINLSGVFDNWAWAFIHRHGLLQEVGGRLNVGMFKEATQRLLPTTLREYVQSENISSWHNN